MPSASGKNVGQKRCYNQLRPHQNLSYTDDEVVWDSQTDFVSVFTRPQRRDFAPPRRSSGAKPLRCGYINRRWATKKQTRISTQ